MKMNAGQTWTNQLFSPRAKLNHIVKFNNRNIGAIWGKNVLHFR